MKFLKPKFCYVIKNRKFYLYLIPLLVVLAMWNYLAGGKPMTASDSWWHGLVEPFVGISTLFTAMAVWWGEISEDWRESLPKRLTVEYWFQGRLYMHCENAYLSGEADIRPLGQQIGGQMAASELDGTPEKLAFKAAAVKSSVGELQCVEGKIYLPYTVCFELLKLPPKLEKLEQGKHYKWNHSFDEVKAVDTPTDRKAPEFSA